MDITLLLKAVGVGLLVSVAYQILQRSGRDEQAMLVSIAGILVVLLMLVGQISSLITSLRGIFGI